MYFGRCSENFSVLLLCLSLVSSYSSVGWLVGSVVVVGRSAMWCDMPAHSPMKLTINNTVIIAKIGGWQQRANSSRGGRQTKADRARVSCLTVVGGSARRWFRSLEHLLRADFVFCAPFRWTPPQRRGPKVCWNTHTRVRVPTYLHILMLLHKEFAFVLRCVLNSAGRRRRARISFRPKFKVELNWNGRRAREMYGPTARAALQLSELLRKQEVWSVLSRYYRAGSCYCQMDLWNAQRCSLI